MQSKVAKGVGHMVTALDEVENAPSEHECEEI